MRRHDNCSLPKFSMASCVRTPEKCSGRALKAFYVSQIGLGSTLQNLEVMISVRVPKT